MPLVQPSFHVGCSSLPFLLLAEHHIQWLRPIDCRPRQRCSRLLAAEPLDFSLAPLLEHPHRRLQVSSWKVMRDCLPQQPIVLHAEYCHHEPATQVGSLQMIQCSRYALAVLDVLVRLVLLCSICVAIARRDVLWRHIDHVHLVFSFHCSGDLCKRQRRHVLPRAELPLELSQLSQLLLDSFFAHSFFSCFL